MLDLVLAKSVLALLFVRIGQTQGTKWTFHLYPVTWDDAVEICGRSRSELVDVDNHTTEAILLNKWKTQPEQVSSGGSFWVGQLKIFTFADATDMLIWDPAAALGLTETCPRGYPASGIWEMTSCENTAFFTCEYSLGLPCRYGRIPEMTLRPSDGTFGTQLITNVTISHCLQKCSNYLSMAVEECWAVTFGDPYPNVSQCYLHYGPHVLDIQSEESRIDRVNFTLYVKDCFAVEVKGQGDEPLSDYVTTSTGKWTSTTGERLSSKPTSPTKSTVKSTTEQGPVWTSISESKPEERTSEKTTVTDFKVSSTTDVPPRPEKTTSNSVDLERSTQRSMATSPDSYADSTLADETEICRCTCPDTSPEEEAVFIEEILTTLKVNSTKLSSTRRKLQSAPDNRPSSQVMGYVGGIFIVFVLGFIISSDIITFYSCVKVKAKSSLP